MISVGHVRLLETCPNVVELISYLNTWHDHTCWPGTVPSTGHAQTCRLSSSSRSPMSIKTAENYPMVDHSKRPWRSCYSFLFYLSLLSLLSIFTMWRIKLAWWLILKALPDSYVGQYAILISILHLSLLYIVSVMIALHWYLLIFLRDVLWHCRRLVLQYWLWNGSWEWTVWSQWTGYELSPLKHCLCTFYTVSQKRVAP